MHGGWVASSRATLEIPGQERVCGAWPGLLPTYALPESHCYFGTLAQGQSDGLRTLLNFANGSQPCAP